MALTETRPDATADAPGVAGRPAPGPLERMAGTGDHVSIGRIWIGSSLVLLALALVGRFVFGIDLATDNGLLGDNQAMLGNSSLMAVALIGVVPLLLGLATAVVPLQIGSPSVAFPRAAALALWGWLVSAIIFMTSVVLRGGVGGTDTEAARLGNVALGGMLVAIALGSVCIATTVMSSRPEGMGLARVPMFAWSMLVAATVWIVTAGAMFAHVVVGQISQADSAGLAENFTEGLLWALRGPSVYALAIPVLGIAADVVITASGRGPVPYGAMQGVVGAYGALSLGIWAQVPEAVDTVLWTLFALGIAAVVLAALGGLADVLRRGPVTAGAPLVASLLALLLLLGAVACGLLIALDRAGSGELWGLDQGLLVVGQASFVLGAAAAGGLAGMFHWTPLVWGGRVQQGLGAAAALMVLVGSGLLGTVAIVQSIVQREDPTSGAAPLGALVAAGSVLFLLGVLSGLAGSLTAARSADSDDDEPAGQTLEWAFPRPTNGGSVPDDLPAVTSPYPLRTEETD